MSKTLNRGEWSEFYAFIKILSDRKLAAADANLQPILKENYPVIKVLRNSENTNRTYDLTDEGVVHISIEEHGADAKVFTVEDEKLRKITPRILAAIKNSKGRSFAVSEATSLVTVLDAGKVKAKSSSKGDIEIVIHDAITSLPTTVEYSIKSYIGNKPTLLNASQATNFVFRINGFNGNIDDINSIDTRSKIQDRVKTIIVQGGEFEFLEVKDPTFQSNLRKLDTKMPAFIAEYLKVFATGQATKLHDITKIIASDNRIDKIADYKVSFDEIKYKLKHLLVNVALGMVPKTHWDGFIKADGGYIVVKEDGEIVCFHIYNISHLSEYLFNNTNLQNHSSSRNKFGKFYEENGELKFNLNLNIRFS